MTLFFFYRLSTDSPAEQETHTREEVDNSIPEETEPPAVESWRTLNHNAVDQVLRDGGLFVWRNAVLLGQQYRNTHGISYSIVTSILMFWTFCTRLTWIHTAPIAHTIWFIIYHGNKIVLVW